MNAENSLSTKIKIIISMIILFFILLIASINSLAVKPDKIIEETIIPVKPKTTKQISPRRIVPKFIPKVILKAKKNTSKKHKKSPPLKKISKEKTVKETNLAKNPESLIENSKDTENKNQNFISENKYIIIFFALLPIVILVYFLNKKRKKQQSSAEEEIDYEFME